VISRRERLAVGRILGSVAVVGGIACIAFG
jgi:hypothetical protein